MSQAKYLLFVGEIRGVYVLRIYVSMVRWKDTKGI